MTRDEARRITANIARLPETSTASKILKGGDVSGIGTTSLLDVYGGRGHTDQLAVYAPFRGDHLVTPLFLVLALLVGLMGHAFLLVFAGRWR